MKGMDIKMIVLYYHGGSANHGCEAIVRSTQKMLRKRLTLFSSCIEEEYRYNIDQIVDVYEDKYKPVKVGTIKYLYCAIYSKLYHNDYNFIKYGHKEFLSKVLSGDICVSIGGDNYCYAGVDKLSYYNRMIHEKGAKTVLWGCSIDPSVLTESVIEDLKCYDLITVRESLSYDGLKHVGISDNVLLCPDPAFQLERIECSLPLGFTEKSTIGINVSPLVADYGSMVMENYEELIRYILEKTDYKIILIPHVVKIESDDRQTLKFFLEKFRKTHRIALVEDHNCMELKAIISKCRMFIGARTHATIAAYSSHVPTLVAGYSIKARGIAKDIFGTEEHYVIPVQSFTSKSDLTNAFIWLCEHESEIREYLERVMPEYSAKALNAAEAVKRLM